MVILRDRSKPEPLDDNWWPSPLTHISKEDPWADAQVVVAEIRSFDEKSHAGQRTTFSALVPIAQLDEVKKNLAKIGHEPQSSGPHPFADGPYTPKFWVTYTDGQRKTFEPLILCWRSTGDAVDGAGAAPAGSV